MTERHIYGQNDPYAKKESAKPAAPAANDDRGALRRLSDSIDSVFMPVTKKIDAFTGGANHGVFGELGPYVGAIPRGKMPATIRAERDELRKEHPGTFGVGDAAGTLGRDLAITAATGGAGAPLSWANTLGRGAVSGLASGVLNEGTKFIPEAVRSGQDYDPRQGLLRVGGNTAMGTGLAAAGRALGQTFTGRGRIANSGPALTPAEQAAADKALRISAKPGYGLQGPGALNAAEAARAGAHEAPGLAAHGANLETLVKRTGAPASDQLSTTSRVAAAAREQPGAFFDRATQAANTPAAPQFERFRAAMSGPASNAAVASGAPAFGDIAKSGSTLGAGAATLGKGADILTRPGYATAGRLIQEAPRETLQQIGRGSPGMSHISGTLLGLLDALALQATLQPKR